MGDISRHRDIYLNTREAIPPNLLAACKLTVADLTYLELGNYFTDVSQFRDPVFYIFAKQGIWRDEILPKVESKLEIARAVAVLAGAATSAVLLALDRPKNALAAFGAGTALGAIPTDLIAGLPLSVLDMDEWIDRMFGKPIERLGKGRKRTSEEYGYVGQFFEHFVEGITHLLFAKEISNQVKGDWGKIDRISQSSVTAVFKEFFTQYYPHEHTDQPPYVWDASQRPKNERYRPSRRQDGLKYEGGVMNVVDKDYNKYLAQRLTQLEDEFRKIKPSDPDAAEKHRIWLVRVGKILHGIEDWYFHSNIVELIRLRTHQSRSGEAKIDEEFVKSFVGVALKDEAEFNSPDADKGMQAMLKRRLYRRLRYPTYERGDKINSGGILSKTKPSTLSVNHAYPAFPSQQDSTHTLLGALGNLEHKAKGSHDSDVLETLNWLPCALDKLRNEENGRKLFAEKAQARGVSQSDFALAIATWKLTGKFPTGPVSSTILDVLRDWLPLIATLMSERERKRLVADVDPLQWPVSGEPPATGKEPGKVELDKQLERHKEALKPKKNAAGVSENNYEQAIRFLHECEFINDAGRSALENAFKIDQKSEASHSEAPGSGGILIQFAVKLQRALNDGERVTKQLNQKSIIFQDISDNGSFNEIVGSHSLMSKDTRDSHPFFDDAKVLASVASQSVFHILLEEVSALPTNTGLDWQKILHHFIRFPVAAGGWERRAMTFFRESKEPKRLFKN